MDSKLIFTFKPDVDMDTKIKIHIDVTLATPCKSIGADILDSTNQNVFSFGVLEEDDTWFELCPEQRRHFEYIQNLNAYLREEYHSLAVSIWFFFICILYFFSLLKLHDYIFLGCNIQRSCT